MRVNEMITELEKLRDSGWGECNISVYDVPGPVYTPIMKIQAYCGSVLIIREM